MKRLRSIMIIGAGLVSLSVVAQQDEQPTIIQDIVTIGERSIKLRDAHRIGSQPQIFDTVITRSNVTYTLRPALFPTRYQVMPIEAANLKIVDALAKLYRGYVRAGVGMYTTPLAEVYYNSIRSRTGGFGVHARHLSSAGGIKDVVSNGAFSDNKVQLWGKAFIKKHALGGELFYKRDMFNYYGYSPQKFNSFENTDPSVSVEDLLQQKYYQVGGGVKLESYFDDLKKLNHSIDLAYYNYSDNNNVLDQYTSRENNFKGTLRLSKQQGKELLSLEAGADYNAFRSKNMLAAADSNQENTILKFLPQINSNAAKYKLRLGLGIYSQLNGTSKFYFFPDAEFSYSLVDKVLMVYAGLTGNVQRNSFLTTTRTNPFAIPDARLVNTVNKYIFTAGLRGNLEANTAFNLKFSQESRNNFQMFVTDTTRLENQFLAIYDNVTVTGFTAEISYDKVEKLQLLLSAGYSLYKLEKEAKAWNIPALKMTLTGKYNIANKLYTFVDLFVEGDRFAKVPSAEGRMVSLGAIADLNLGFEYRYTRRLSVFLNFNNLTGKAYQRWYNYPVQRLGVLGGLSFSF